MVRGAGSPPVGSTLGGMGELSAWHWAVVVLVAVLLFGSQRLPDLARGVGRSARILRAELRADSPPNPADPPDPDAR